MKVIKIFLFAVLIFLCFIPSSHAAIPIISTFDINDEGWTAQAGEGAITYNASGGNPGGFLSIQDIGPSSYVVYPPSKFWGDLSSFDGGLLSYDILQIVPTTELPTSGFSSIGSGFGRIQLVGGGSNATFDYAPDPPVPSPQFWTTYNVPMTADAWHTTQQNWETVLSNVTYFDITFDLHPGEDTIGFDNFKVQPVPEPSTILLFGTGLAGAFFRKRRLWRVFL